MAEFERGQTFIDLKSPNIQGTKPKYFIALNNADFDDDLIICFVMNTEHHFSKYHLKCNKEKSRYILKAKDLTFITDYTSIILNLPHRFTLEEIANSSHIKLEEIAPELMQREIKNCIDFGYIREDWAKLIKESFKNK